MSEQSFIPPEKPDEQSEAWETAMQETARQLNYPPTPDIARAVRRRLAQPSHRRAYNWRLVAAVLVVLLAFSLVVPQVRAFVVEFLRIGAVRIFYGEPTPMPTATDLPPGTPTPLPTPNPIASALDLPGETTFDRAERLFEMPILLPSYPPDLGLPDHVYIDDMVGLVVTLVWTQPDDPAAIRLVMQILTPTSIAAKYLPWDFNNEHEATVNGEEAVWLTGVHQIFYFRDGQQISRIVDRNVLIWAQDELTYRLETDLSLEATVRVAESLR